MYLKELRIEEASTSASYWLTEDEAKDLLDSYSMNGFIGMTEAAYALTKQARKPQHRVGGWAISLENNSFGKFQKASLDYLDYEDKDSSSS